MLKETLGEAKQGVAERLVAAFERQLATVFEADLLEHLLTVVVHPSSCAAFVTLVVVSQGVVQVRHRLAL
jgi:hypothetical protein